MKSNNLLGRSLLWTAILLLFASSVAIVYICIFCGTIGTEGGSFFMTQALPGTGDYEEDASSRVDQQLSTYKPPAMTAEEVEELPTDKLFITTERQYYVSGELTLVIPRLSLTVSVLNGTSMYALNKAVGLYDYSQLPGEGNRNVSIAGHRDRWVNGKSTDDAPFYYIHTIVDGDFLYLYDASNIYKYLYKDTKVVQANDWGPIYSQGFSCLTLTSCEPIGVSTHRIVVRAELVEILPYSDSYEFV